VIERFNMSAAPKKHWLPQTGLGFIAGPCAIESRSFALETAEELKGIFDKAGLLFIYKSSFDKANRSSANGFRGVGMDEGLSILAEVRSKLGVRVLTDVHEPWQAKPVAEVVDVLQTPAFLCRQTDFIAAVAAAGKPVNIKKGQFLAPWEMKNVIAKARAAAREAGVPDDHFTACERGTSFGYGNLVVDMRGLQIMAESCGAPVVFDATHSVQLPGAQGTSSGGQRQYVPHLARAAVATGAVSGVFMEAHPNPDAAPCDGPNMLPFTALPKLLAELKAIHSITRQA
jgi:2-dehydro-3-deoxyphosphooctonate aldolase (KDO 8-P synthase)